MLRVPASWFPERLEHENVTDWFDVVKSRFNIELQYLHPQLDELPPSGPAWVRDRGSPISPGKRARSRCATGRSR